MSTQSTPPAPTNRPTTNHAALLPVILEEVLRQRSDQDDRLEYQRRVAWPFFSVFLPGAGLAAFWMLRLEGTFDAYWTWATVAAFACGVISTLKVMETQEWQSGPKIPYLLGSPLRGNWTLEKFLFKLIVSHLDEFKDNERRVRRVKRWSSLMVAFFISSVVFLGATMLSYNSNMQAPEDSDEAARTSEFFGYDDVPFEPTLVEKGDSSYYETRSD
ncbi:MAG: hypothetical protein KTV68_15520 [Acidimicrobiia bacterium]|nr:hypothetical protein [Acidimicrobiia bacterium]